MHELAMAQQIIEAIEKYADQNGLLKVSFAQLKIGKMAGFKKEQLEFCLSTYEKQSHLQDVHFEIEEVPVKLKCKDCSHVYIDDRFEDYEFAHDIAHVPGLYIPLKCSECDSDRIEIVEGKELDLVSIDGV